MPLLCRFPGLSEDLDRPPLISASEVYFDEDALVTESHPRPLRRGTTGRTLTTITTVTIVAPWTCDSDHEEGIS